MHTAMRATSLTLKKLLEDGFDADSELAPLFHAGGGTMIVSLDNPQEFEDDGGQGLSLWLYRLMRDDQRLNAPPERVTPTQLRPTPLPLRLHFMLTPVVVGANTLATHAAEQEQTILGKAMQVLYEHPMLRGTDLEDDFRGTDSVVSVRLEALTLDEVSRVWHALGRPYRLSASYEVSIAYIAPTVQPMQVTPVRVAMPELEQILEVTGVT